MQKIIPPFINITIDETVEKLQNHFYMLRKTISSSDSYIPFTVGVDATVVVKSWQILESYKEIFDGSYPINFLDVTRISHDEIVNLIKECIKGKHIEKSAEVKVYVITL